MYPSPSKAAEAIVAVFVPPACREEVLGDLHERYRSPGQYAFEALCTVPMVILSRVRRTADPQVLLMHAFAMYGSFLVAAWFKDPALLREQWGLLRLASPAGMALIVLMLEDAYARPGKRSPISVVRGPAIGLGLALATQAALVPPWILFYGCAMSFLLSSAIRMLFPPVTSSLQGVNAPALWLKQAGGAVENTPGGMKVVRAAAAIVAVAICLVLMSIAYRLWTRS